MIRSPIMLATLILVTSTLVVHPARGLNAQEKEKQASALSQLNFGVDGPKFTAGIVDLHLPVDPALGAVDVG